MTLSKLITLLLQLNIFEEIMTHFVYDSFINITIKEYHLFKIFAGNGCNHFFEQFCICLFV